MMSTSNPLPPWRRRTVSTASRTALRLVRRVEQSLAGYVDRSPSPSLLSVNEVVDPDGEMTLLGVRGLLSSATVADLRTSFDRIADGAAVHLDLSQATFADDQVVRIVELAIDQLELRHVKIRIVGLDPLHPALTHARRR